MKPVFHTRRPARDGESNAVWDHNFHTAPATDWSYQASAPTLRGGPASFTKDNGAAFRALSSSFFNHEARRVERIDAAIFGTIVLLGLWPITMAVRAALHLMG